MRAKEKDAITGAFKSRKTVLHFSFASLRMFQQNTD